MDNQQWPEDSRCGTTALPGLMLVGNPPALVFAPVDTETELRRVLPSSKAFVLLARTA